ASTTASSRSCSSAPGAASASWVRAVRTRIRSTPSCAPGCTAPAPPPSPSRPRPSGHGGWLTPLADLDLEGPAELHGPHHHGDRLAAGLQGAGRDLGAAVLRGDRDLRRALLGAREAHGRGAADVALQRELLPPLDSARDRMAGRLGDGDRQLVIRDVVGDEA